MLRVARLTGALSTDSRENRDYTIAFVASGGCELTFERQCQVLTQGETYIFSPDSGYCLDPMGGGNVYLIRMDPDWLHAQADTLLSQRNLMAFYFSTSGKRPNYLRYYVEDSAAFEDSLLREAVEEERRVRLMLEFLQQRCGHTLQLYDSRIGTNFVPIIQYIQSNFRTVTLGELSSEFHYSEPYICTLISQHMGQSFTGLVRQLRMAEAVLYLRNSEMKIYEIARCVGYQTSDQFSRTFRQIYRIGPQEFRRRCRQGRI